MTTPKRVVVLTGSDLQHRYVAAALADLPNVVGIVVTRQPKIPLLKRIDRARRRFGFFGMLSRILLKLTLKVTGETSRRNADLARVLGKSEFPKHIPTFETVGVNSPRTQAILRNLHPDIICVYGTYIVSDPTLAIASQIALNLHTGISPRYRGADCEFWPLHQRELKCLGATVHTCTAELDGGAIFGTVEAKLEADDRVGAVFGRCVVVGSKLYKEVVDNFAVSSVIKPAPQDLSTGKEYRVSMRGWLAESRVAWLIGRGLIRNNADSTRGIQNSSGF